MRFPLRSIAVVIVAGLFLAGGWISDTVYSTNGVGTGAVYAQPFGVEGDSIVIKEGSTLFLEPNVPNPFVVRTRISYTLDRETMVLLRVYDAFYNDVITLVEEDSQQPGRYDVDFVPAGRYGSGMYFYSLTTNAGTETRRMLFVE